MPRGGKRQGTQGKGYSNRTDLGIDYAPGGNPAAGGIPIRQPETYTGPAVGADQVPNIYDPSSINEPITSGLATGLGPGPEALGPMPPTQTDPVRQVIQAMMFVAPNPDLARVLARLDFEGR